MSESLVFSIGSRDSGSALSSERYLPSSFVSSMLTSVSLACCSHALFTTIFRDSRWQVARLGSAVASWLAATSGTQPVSPCVVRSSSSLMASRSALLLQTFSAAQLSSPVVDHRPSSDHQLATAACSLSLSLVVQLIGRRTQLLSCKS